MTPAVLLPSVIPSANTHVRRYDDNGRPYWSCSAVGGAPCPGHAAPIAKPVPPPQLHAEQPCASGHPLSRMRVRYDKQGFRRRRCLDCGLIRWHDRKAA